MSQQPMKRRIYLVDKHFQYAFMLRFSGAVIAGIVLAFAILSAFYYVRYSQADLSMKFYYATGVPGTGFQQTTLLDLVWPALVISALLSCALTLFFGLFYSHRIAGPIHHLKRVLREVRDGKLDQVVRLRKGDEFHELAEELTDTLKWVREHIRR